jgi:hypothetical protein
MLQPTLVCTLCGQHSWRGVTSCLALCSIPRLSLSFTKDGWVVASMDRHRLGWIDGTGYGARIIRCRISRDSQPLLSVCGFIDIWVKWIIAKQTGRRWSTRHIDIRLLVEYLIEFLRYIRNLGTSVASLWQWIADLWSIITYINFVYRVSRA